MYLIRCYSPRNSYLLPRNFLIMRDVHYGWLIRYLHANVASFFFIFVYLHIGRGLYYGSYRSPRTLVWSIGVIILVLMMAINISGLFEYTYSINIEDYHMSYSSLIPYYTSRTRVNLRISPHNKVVLDVLVCGLLGYL